MEKFCQSCARPLKENRGREKNGSLSDEYCYQCYDKGVFLEPNLTYNQMLERGLDGIDKNKGNKIKKYFMKKFYPSMLRKVKRYRN